MLLAVGGVAMMAMAGLALDAGFEAGRYRVAQNAADAAALQVANQIFSAEYRSGVRDDSVWSIPFWTSPFFYMPLVLFAVSCCGSASIIYGSLRGAQ